MNTIAAGYDAIILGAGGAGLMCAATAGQRGRRVLLIDHCDQPGKKILISGGGRCNFTNIHTNAARYLSQNRHFAKSALSRYGPEAFIELVNAYDIAWHEKTLGQLFCDGSARQIVAMLRDECAKGDVTLRLGAPVRDVRHEAGIFSMQLCGQTISAPALVIATGGPSIPKMGASAFAFELAKRFDLDLVPPRPALVPLTLSQNDAAFLTLAGISTKVIAQCGRTSFEEAALFTHRGLSGPAILQISSYWQAGDQIALNFLPGLAADWLVQQKRTAPRTSLSNALAQVLPIRLVRALVALGGIADDQLANIADRRLSDFAHRLADWSFCPSGSEGYAKAEVTCGGVATKGLSSKTMQARHLPGLYVIGEAVDVTGWLGGYNFQWAWASGWAAGQNI